MYIYNLDCHIYTYIIHIKQVYDFTGDNIEEFACKTGSGSQISNQAFAINVQKGTITNTYNGKVKCMTLLKPQ